MDQYDLKILDHIRTDTGNSQRIYNIQFFHKTDTKSAADLRKHKCYDRIYTDQYVITTSPEGRRDPQTVKSIPGIRKNCGNRDQINNAQEKNDYSFKVFSLFHISSGI